MEPVRSHFDSLASSYRSNYSSSRSSTTYDFRTRRKLVSRLIGSYTSGYLLDVACGTGEIVDKLLSSNNFTTAVLCDISENMLKFADHTLSNGYLKTHSQFAHESSSIRFVHSSVFDFENPLIAKYDVILCLGLLAHTGKLDVLLSKLTQSLSPDGIIILQSSLVDNPFVMFSRFVSGLTHKKRFGYPLHYYSFDNILNCCISNSLHVHSFIRYKLGIPYLDKIFPSLNYYIEVIMEPFMRRFGSESLFVLKLSQPPSQSPSFSSTAIK